ncbi:MAG: bifunctional 5,10-methylenetetrahydrofolate dehydrogenase/5,10-methenyltetrahydrofolate cyclohydrolase [Candidatus Kerfeldbacteria bacterium]|jgi:methylenetetrahydrofolate dehydrogenase (NADP+) / methenyltetrahydrofolate cyclohydrolase
MKILDGKKIANSIQQDLKRRIAKFDGQPCLAIILIGDDLGSHIYVSLKEKAANKVGIKIKKYLLPVTISQREIIDIIESLNINNEVNGILVQFPLPKNVDEDIIIASIEPKKDVDGFHPENIKLLLKGKECLIPGLAEGVVILLEETKEILLGKKAVVLANSEVFSKPLEYLLKQKEMEVEVSHPDKDNYKEVLLQADIVIAVLGRPNFIKEGMIKKDAIIIDVGYNLVDNKAIGDVDYESAKNKVSWITPVPGGVGPMTVAMLLKNVVRAYEKQKSLNI